ncbi:MAG: dTDP-4-dehydrorhamnose reductase [Candidatus Competibacteraceae bacterium]
MKIVVTGANGQVGRELTRLGGKHELLALDRAALDITAAPAIPVLLEEARPAVVINAAAYTAVDRAEQEPESAFAVNREGPRHLAVACRRLQIPLLHLSTDYVFDGTQHQPYREEDPVAPLGVYGRSKWEGEEAVRQAQAAHLILRVSWVFGEHGHNFVKTILRLAGERDELRVVMDQRGCPTYAGDIARVLLALAERIGTGREKAWAGTYHYCGTPATTWYGFAQAIIELARAYEPLRVRTLVPITTAEYPTPARRPANSVLACDRFEARFGMTAHPWREGLATTVQALLGERSE